MFFFANSSDEKQMLYLLNSSNENEMISPSSKRAVYCGIEMQGTPALNANTMPLHFSA